MAPELTMPTTINILDQLNEGVIVVESDGTIQYLNRSALALLELDQKPATLYEAVTPYESWQELLRNEGLSHLYIDGDRIEVQTSVIEWNGRLAKQLTLSSSRLADQDVSEERRLGEQLVSLNRISLQLSSTLRLTDILKAVIDEAMINTGADGGRISLYNKHFDTFVTRFSRGEVASSELTADDEQAVFDDRSGLIRCNLPRNHQNKIQSVLISPIIYEGNVAGLITLHSLEEDGFDDQTQTYIQALANHTAIAIGNAQRFEELNNRSAELHTHTQQIENFVESSRVLHGDRPLSDIYEDLVYAIQEGMGYQIVVLNLIDTDRRPPALRIVSAAGLSLNRLDEVLGTSQNWEKVKNLLRPEFALGAAYFIPAEMSAAYADVDTYQFSELYNQPETDEPLYHVVFVARDDVLNVRRQPGVGNPIVGTLAYDAKNIRVTGPAQYVDDSPWVPIQFGALTGWVNKNFLNSGEGVEGQRWDEEDLFIIPLIGSDGDPIGLISLDSPNDGRRPTLNTVKALEIFANQTATAIENTRLFHDTREFAEILQQLHSVSQDILREQDFKTQLELIIKGLQDSGWGRVSLTIRDEDLNPKMLVTAGLTQKEEAFLRNNMLPPEKWRERLTDKAYQKYKHGSTYFLPADDPWAQEKIGVILPDNTAVKNDPDAWHPNDLLFLPLYDRKENVIALISLDAPPGGKRPTPRMLQMVELYVQVATPVIENALLYQETQRQLAELKTVNEVSQAISTIIDLNELMENIGKSLAAAYNVDSYYISLYQPDEDVLSFPLLVDHNAPVSTAEIPADRGPTNYIFRSGEPLLIHSKSEWEILDYKVYGELSESYLGVPMRSGDQVIGVLAIQNYEKSDAFSQQDIKPLSTIASQAAVAVENARLVTELRNLNEELDERVAKRTLALGKEKDRGQFLLRVTTELTASLDVDRVLSRSLELVNEAVNAPQGGILLVNAEEGSLVYRAAFDDSVSSIPKRGKNIPSKFDEGLARWLIQNREPIIIDDIREDNRWKSQPQNPEHRSVLAVPLISSEEIIGVMMLFHKDPSAFTKEQLELVEAAAVQVASAVSNAQLYLLIRDQAEKLGKMLREEQVEAAKMQAMLESIADGVLVTDENGQVILANRPASLILDISRNRLIGKTLKELLGLYSSTGESWIQTIETWSKNVNLVRQNAYLADRLMIEDLVVSVQLSPVIANNQFFGTVSIFRDITQEVEVDRMKSEFVSTVSHELRTPMTSIKGYADLILMGAAGPMSEPQVRYMEVIKNNADRLSMLVNDLLDISRIETGKTDLDLRPLDVPQIIEQVVDGHLRGRIEHDEKSIEVYTEMTPSLPLVNADHARITQVLTNLLDNALDYTPPDGRIDVNVRANGDFVFISISDTGIGISQENQQKIFDRFFRAEDSEVQKIAGTGLGLSIVHSLIEMHGGNIEVQSVPGKGSTFTFCLPVVAEESDII